MNNLELLIPLIFFLIFPLFWCFVLLILSLTSGWQTLARHYRYERPFTGTTVHMQSARIRRTNFSSVLTVGFNDVGLYLVPMILFRPFHPPLFIPWHALQAEEARLFLFSGYRLRSKKAPKINIFLYPRLYKQFASYLDEW